MRDSSGPGLTCDVAVIGAGTAGLAAFRAARAAGARALLIERGPGGTTCARVGCMPSKLLIAAGSVAHAARGAGLFGVRVAGVEVNGPAVVARLRAERDRFVEGVLDGVAEIPEAMRLSGAARFLDPATLAVTDADGGETRVRFRAAVVATGSAPSVPPPLRGAGPRVFTTDTVFEIEDLPESLAVIGAGAVGIEIAQAMARLGVRVSAFDTGTAIAGLTHPDLTRQAVAIFADEVRLHLGATITGAQGVEGGVRLAWTREDGAEESGVFAAVLAAAGRPPALPDLALDRAGLSLDEHGVPRFDPRTQVCVREDGAEGGAAVLIAGDADAARPVLHEASRQGEIAGRNAAALAAGGTLESTERWPALAMVFTHPQTAAVGAPYDLDADRVVGEAGFEDQGRARVEGTNRGGLRVWADRGGRLLGGEMLGPGVEHLAHLLAHALRDGLTARAFLDRPWYHPTVEEALRTAIRAIDRQVPPDRG